jgi:hypothetical protein
MHEVFFIIGEGKKKVKGRKEKKRSKKKEAKKGKPSSYYQINNMTTIIYITPPSLA